MKIDVIISSPLKRAKDSAMMISKFHPQTPIKFVNELKEMNFGDFQGKCLKKLGIKREDTFWLSAENNGESIYHIYTRAKRFLKNIKKAYPKKKILIIGHATINRALVCAIKKFPTDKSLKIIANPNYIVHGTYTLANMDY